MEERSEVDKWSFVPRDVLRVIASLLLSELSTHQISAFRLCCKATSAAVDEAVERLELRLRSREDVEVGSRKDVVPAEVQRLLCRVAGNLAELTVKVSPASMTGVDLGVCTKLSRVNLYYYYFHQQNHQQNHQQQREEVENDVLAPLATCKHIRAVCVACPFLSDLATLGRLGGNLRCLSLEYCKRLTSLTPLSKCERLNSLQLKYCSSVPDFTPLRACTELDRLVVLSCSPFDESNGPLRLCVHPIRELQLTIVDSRGLSDLEPLRECGRTLRKLVLTLVRSEDLSPLAACTELRELHLECPASDVSPLAFCKKLRSVYLGGCNVRDLSPLSSCFEMEALFIPRCPGVTELSSLGSRLLSKLCVLNVAGCRNLASLPPSPLENLSSLNLSCCTKLSDLSRLSACCRLTDLNLAYCSSLTDLTPLSSCNLLVELDLSGCVAVTDLSPLTKCKSLVEVDLSGLDFHRGNL